MTHNLLRRGNARSVWSTFRELLRDSPIEKSVLLHEMADATESGRVNDVQIEMVPDLRM